MKRINISPVDTIFANGCYPIELLIYYKNKLSSKKIRPALKKLSSDFWPIFGEYRAGVIQFDRYSESEHFDEIALDREFDPGEPAEAVYDRYSRLIPSDSKKLFFLKIIQHKNGTVLVPKLNHLAGDGYSYFFFLSALAALCHVGFTSFKKKATRDLYKPHHQRTVLKEFKFDDADLKNSRVRKN